MSDSLKIWGTDYTDVKGFKAKDANNNQYAYVRPQGAKSISANGTGIDVSEYATVDVNVSGGGTLTIDSLTVTPSTSQQVFNSSSVDGYKPVTVEAMPSGTEGTPTATKSTVSNQSVSVTPSVTNSAGYIAGGTHTGTPVTVTAAELASGNKAISANGTGIDVVGYETVSVAVPSSTPTLQTKSVTPTESAQVIAADSGYDGLGEVDVAAISSTYVGSGITRRDSTDLTKSGATISVPAGYYEAAASKSVTTGSASVPATTIEPTVTISVTSGGAIVAYASGSSSITPDVNAGYVSYGAAGRVTIDGYATQALSTQAAQTIHPSTTDQTIASQKFLTGAQTIKAVAIANLTADNIKNGVTVTIGDSDDPDCVASVTGTYSGGSSKNIQVYRGYDTTSATSYTATDVSITVAKTGTYNVSWMGYRNTTSGTSGSQLYKNGTAVGSASTTFVNSYGQNVSLTDQSFNKGDVLVVRARARNTSYVMGVGNLIIEEQ